MPLLRSTVTVTNNFPRITKEVNALAQRAVSEAAHTGGAVASQVAAQRSKTGAMAGIKVTAVRGSVNGWEASFLSPVSYAWFQNYGTLGSRRKRLKQSPASDRTREAGTGIKPLGFLDAGRRAGRKAMLETIRRGL